MAESTASGAVRAPGLALVPVRDRVLGWCLTVGGLLGFVAAFALSYERYRLFLDPEYTPSCSLNPIVSCGSVMTSEQASVFGFPNSFLGLAAFPVLVTLGILLLSGVRLPRWILAGMQVGVVLGAAMVGWLVYQSLYRIGALCPYCMVVWAAMVPLLVYVTAYNLDRFAASTKGATRSVLAVFVEYRLVVVFAIYVAIVAMILVRFWAYWSTLI